MNEAQQNAFHPFWWDTDALCMIDQRLLPGQEVIIRCTRVDQVASAIRSLQVRGAPAIGCTAAYGMALEARRPGVANAAALLVRLEAAKVLLDAQRPTAVNLSWATARVLERVRAASGGSVAEIARTALDEAHAIRSEDLAMCYAIGRHGAELIPARGHVLTHCNAGGLATAGYGTALAPIRFSHEQGRSLHVYVDETRPFLQGARLTAWELQQVGIPLTLITDNMAAYFMQQRAIDCIIVGADRIVANGDVANKIGTYLLAVAARYHGVRFMVVAPTSTVDMSVASGSEIPIE
ncbi:MAG TPA: S-methyl-5-thioribose-1-phosphate isomerase, partial [Roseiflexaceae bacterium]|nr:S-methyl-5-thioribose-1-phosphate isomerase [Roseiflexaceae bacterium]